MFCIKLRSKFISFQELCIHSKMQCVIYFNCYLIYFNQKVQYQLFINCGQIISPELFYAPVVWNAEHISF